MTDLSKWSVWEISDSDEPEEHGLAGMRHRDFNGVLLLLVPDGEPSDPDWYGNPKTPRQAAHKAALAIPTVVSSLRGSDDDNLIIFALDVFDFCLHYNKHHLIALSCRLIRVLFALGRKRVPYDPIKSLGPVHMERLQNAA